MVDVIPKSDPLNPDLYFLEEVQSSGSTSSSWRVTLRSHIWRPPTDVYETKDVVVVRVEVAGMREEDFSISLSGKNLVIRGVRTDIPERRAYHQMEIVFGEFMSEVELPCDVYAEQAKAEYKLGFLRLELPKTYTQKIQIRD